MLFLTLRRGYVGQPSSVIASSVGRARPMGFTMGLNHHLIQQESNYSIIFFFTQGFVRGTKKPKINPGAGLVEHVIHEKVNAGLKKSLVTSDHRPVSIEIDV